MANAMLAVNFIPNKFGRVQLELNGYQYMVKNNRSDRRYWKCIVQLQLTPTTRLSPKVLTTIHMYQIQQELNQ